MQKKVYKKKSNLQIFKKKNNKLITNICTNDQNLFTLNTNPMKGIEYNTNSIDLKLWHARLEKNHSTKQPTRVLYHIQIMHSNIIVNYLTPHYHLVDTNII